jgi:hypothetical protein
MPRTCATPTQNSELLDLSAPFAVVMFLNTTCCRHADCTCYVHCAQHNTHQGAQRRVEVQVCGQCAAAVSPGSQTQRPGEALLCQHAGMAAIAHMYPARRLPSAPEAGVLAHMHAASTGRP